MIHIPVCFSSESLAGRLNESWPCLQYATIKVSAPSVCPRNASGRLDPVSPRGRAWREARSIVKYYRDNPAIHRSGSSRICHQSIDVPADPLKEMKMARMNLEWVGGCSLICIRAGEK